VTDKRFRQEQAFRVQQQATLRAGANVPSDYEAKNPLTIGKRSAIAGGSPETSSKHSRCTTLTLWCFNQEDGSQILLLPPDYHT